jgi:hypothetical protein
MSKSYFCHKVLAVRGMHRMIRAMQKGEYQGGLPGRGNMCIALKAGLG